MTITTTEEAKQEPKPDTTVRVLRSDTCPSLSGKSTLTYELGADDRAQLQLRIAKNSAAGMFSPAWIPWEDIQRVLEAAADTPVTSHTVQQLYRGKSASSGGF